MPSRVILAAALVVAVASLLFGTGLGGSPLYDPDEARHAEIAREMASGAEARDWALPRLNDAPYRNKPPLHYAVVAATYLALGVSEAAARLPSVVGGISIALLVTVWGATRWGPRAGALAGLVLVTAPEFGLLARFATPDMAMTWWITAGILAVHRFAARPGRSLVPAAVAGAAGLLTKGLVAPGIIALVGLAHLAHRRRLRLLTPRAVLVAGGVFLLLVVPWHVAVWRADPAYLTTLYVDQQWNRAVAAGDRLHAHSPLFYLPILFVGFLPWSALLPATLRATAGPERRDPAVTFCVVWALTVLLVFSVPQGKVPSYILPAFPPLALLTGRFVGLALAGVLQPAETRLLRAGLWIAAGAFVVTSVAAVILGAVEYDRALLWTSLWTVVLVAPAAGVAWLLRRGRTRGALLTVAATAGLLAVGFAQLVAPALMEVHSDATAARAILAEMPDQAEVPLVGYHIQSHSLVFYLRRPMLLLDRPRQLQRLLARHPRIIVLTSPRHVAELERAGPFRLWIARPRRHLYRSDAP